MPLQVRGNVRQAVLERLLAAAVVYAAGRGARIVEGYPIHPRSANLPGAFAWTGFVSAFQQAGFIEVAHRSPACPIMRYHIPSLDDED